MSIKWFRTWQLLLVQHIFLQSCAEGMINSTQSILYSQYFTSGSTPYPAQSRRAGAKFIKTLYSDGSRGILKTRAHDCGKNFPLATRADKGMYSLSNVTVVNEKFTSFQQCLRYCHKSGIIVFSIPVAILLAWAPIAGLVFARLCLLVHAIYSWDDLHLNYSSTIHKM